jgi:YidC/Oxa1 family membrane protein insertase
LDFFAFLKPIEIAVAWLMVEFYDILTSIGMSGTSGWTWALSIVGLVIVIRILLIPLFVKQIKASRGMQLIQPEMKKIQAKYKGKTDQASRQAMTQETMALYKRTGTNPFASCLPILLQSPIFFALFRVLNNLVNIASGKQQPIGPMTQELAARAEASTLFGAQLSSTFLNSSNMSVKILTVVLIVLMSASTFTTQKQLMTKNMPAAALDNPFARQQKMLMYALPLIFAVSGVNFPIGVLIYWLTTNVWSMGQQFYVIRRMPAPGSAAEKALDERRARKGLTSRRAVVEEVEEPAPEPVKGQRVQPKRKDRQRKSAAGGGGAKGAPDPGPNPDTSPDSDLPKPT